MRVILMLTLIGLEITTAHAKQSKIKENDNLYYSFYKEDNPEFEKDVRDKLDLKEQLPMEKHFAGSKDQYKHMLTNTYFIGEKAYDHVYFDSDKHSSSRVDLNIEYTYYIRRCAKRVYGPSPVQSHCVKWLNEPKKGETVYHLDFTALNGASDKKQVHLLIRRNSNWQRKPKLENIAIVSHDLSYKIKKKRLRKKFIISGDY